MAADPNPVPVPDEKLVRVFDAEQESEVLVVRGLLESQGIDCQMTALDIPQDVMPIGGAVILVREEDAVQARQLIDDYRRAPGDESDLNSAEATKESLPPEK
ncbi:MAG TPA: DUF2007 domain-containing protein [Terriglobales bacterium]